MIYYFNLESHGANYKMITINNFKFLFYIQALTVVILCQGKLLDP